MEDIIRQKNRNPVREMVKTSRARTVSEKKKTLSTDETIISLNLCTIPAPTQNYGKTCSRHASSPEFFHIPYALPWSFRADGDIIFWRLLETNNWECHDSLYEVYLWSVQNAGRSVLHQGAPLGTLLDPCTCLLSQRVCWDFSNTKHLAGFHEWALLVEVSTPSLDLQVL